MIGERKGVDLKVKERLARTGAMTVAAVLVRQLMVQAMVETAAATAVLQEVAMVLVTKRYMAEEPVVRGGKVEENESSGAGTTAAARAHKV